MGRKYTYVFLLPLFFLGCEKNNPKDLDFLYKSLYKKAVIEYKNLNIEESNALFLELLSYAKNVNSTDSNQRIHLIALNYLGDIYLKSGESKMAYEEFEEALKLAEKYDNEPYQVQALLDIAELEEDPDKVEQILFKTTQKFGSNIANKHSIDQIKHELGLLYASNYRTEEALRIFNELLQEDYPDRIKSYFYEGLGISYRNNGDFKSAIESFDNALELSEDINKLYQLNILVEKSNLYLMSKEFLKFEKLIQQIKPSIDTVQDLNLRKRVNELMLNLYNQTNNIDGKVKALSELLPLNEKIYKQSNASLGSIALNLKHIELKRETEAQKEKNKQLVLSLILAGLLLILSLLSFILFYKFSKKQAEFKLLEKQQEVKDEQAKRKDVENQLAQESMNAYMNGQEEERKQHAAQLHDSLGANLAAVNMHLSLLKKDVPEKKYDRISGMLKNVITETRNISHNIMPPLLVNQGVIAAISEKAIEWSHPKLQIDTESNVEKVALDDSLEIALYRGVLECVNNIIRSAEASKAKIIFEQLENNTLHITITDNGKGFDKGILERGEGGLGINGVKNRIKYFKGNFNIESEIGKGTTVYINVPILKMKQTA